VTSDLLKALRSSAIKQISETYPGDSRHDKQGEVSPQRIRRKEHRMNVSIEQLGSDRWEARLSLATPAGSRYFRESGQNRTAALLALRQSLGRYRGESYRHARAAVLEQALA